MTSVVMHGVPGDPPGAARCYEDVAYPGERIHWHDIRCTGMLKEHCTLVFFRLGTDEWGRQHYINVVSAVILEWARPPVYHHQIHPPMGLTAM